jgi:hypothetical protein
VVRDSFITFNGPNPSDVIRIRRLSELGSSPPVNLYSFTGGGLHTLDVGANFGEEVFFVREDSSGTVLMRSLPNTKILAYGDLGEVNLFYGEEVQLAQSSTVELIKILVEAVKSKTDNLPSDPSSENKVQEAINAAKLAAALSS